MLPSINIHQSQTVILCSVKHSHLPRLDSNFLNLELTRHVHTSSRSLSIREIWDSSTQKKEFHLRLCFKNTFPLFCFFLSNVFFSPLQFLDQSLIHHSYSFRIFFPLTKTGFYIFAKGTLNAYIIQNSELKAFWVFLFTR